MENFFRFSINANRMNNSEHLNAKENKRGAGGGRGKWGRKKTKKIQISKTTPFELWVEVGGGGVGGGEVKAGAVNRNQCFKHKVN